MTLLNACITAVARARRVARQYPDLASELYEHELRSQISIIEEGIQLSQSLRSTNGQSQHKSCNVFHVTIRPREGAVEIDDFVGRVKKLAHSKCWTHAFFVFEQCEHDDDSVVLGRGMHAHVVVKTPKYNRAQIRQRVMSSFADICGTQSVSVDAATRPQELVRDYLLNHVGRTGQVDDKALTKRADMVWRLNHGIDPFYEVNEGRAEFAEDNGDVLSSSETSPP